MKSKILILLTIIFIISCREKINGNKADKVMIVTLDKVMRDSLYNFSDFNPKYLKEKLEEDSIYSFEYNIPERNIFSTGYYDKRTNKKVGWWQVEYGLYKEISEFIETDQNQQNQLRVYYDDELDTIQSYFVELNRKNNLIYIDFFMHTNGKDSLGINYWINGIFNDPILVGRKKYKTSIEIPLTEKNKVLFQARLTNLLKKDNFVYSQDLFIKDSI
jgi:hypothetical protein